MSRLGEPLRGAAVRQFTGFVVTPDELRVIDQLVEAQRAESRSDLVRRLLADAAKASRIDVPAGAFRKPGRRFGRAYQRIPAEIRDAVVERSRAGERTRDIAAALGLAPSTVSNIRYGANVLASTIKQQRARAREARREASC